MQKVKLVLGKRLLSKTGKSGTPRILVNLGPFVFAELGSCGIPVGSTKTLLVLGFFSCWL